MNWTSRAIVQATAGSIVRGNGSHLFNRIVIDSRVITEGDLIIAVPGRRYDGHRFLAQARANGALGAVVRKGCRGQAAGFDWVMEVEDTVKALGALAGIQRQALKGQVFSITGSAGKTTVKEMLTCILKGRKRVAANVGTQNNHIGVPLTLLRADPEDQVVVVETGTSNFGELAWLAGVTRPTHAVITNIGPAHLELFGSLDGVARAKWELVNGMDPKGTLILNRDDPRLQASAKDFSGKIVWFGTTPEADLQVELRSEEKGQVYGTLRADKQTHELHLPLPGKHNLLNAAAAVACAQLAGVEPEAACASLQSYMPAPGRLELHTIAGVRFIHDAYNANPSSARAAVEALLELPETGNRFVVFGDMAELGEEADQYHAELGRWLGKLPIAGLVTTGKLSEGLLQAAHDAGLKRGQHCESTQQAGKVLTQWVQPQDQVLLKGSRVMQMEKVLHCFMKSSTR